eukprot:Gb_22650 [translate_table: standard]
MVKFAVVKCRLFLLALLFSTVFAEERSGISSSSHEGINRKTWKMSHSVTFRLMHKYGKRSPYRPPNSTWESLVSEMMKTHEGGRHKSIGRSMADSQSWEDADVPVASGYPNLLGYVIEMNIGSPAQRFYPLIDTGSDIAWIRCKPCWICDPQEKHMFKPSKSASYRVLGCDSKKCLQGQSFCGNSKCILLQAYLDKSGFVAILSTDSLSVALIGLGRGNLSFVSQTAHLYDKTFSYCLPSLESDEHSGSLVFGMEALNVKGVKFTPLLTNPVNPSLYYVGLKGISVGGELLSIPPSTFAMDTSNGGGTIIDSGTVISRLVEPAYTTLRDTFRKKLSNLKSRLVESAGLNTCYNISSGSIETPPITFHFEGGLDSELTQENILFEVSTTVLCLAFQGTSSPSSIIGNVQQQNWRVVYDIPNVRLGFAREHCNG